MSGTRLHLVGAPGWLAAEFAADAHGYAAESCLPYRASQLIPDDLIWCSGAYANRLAATPEREHRFTAPADDLLPGLPAKLLGCDVALLPWGEVAQLEGPVFLKPASFKAERLPAGLYAHGRDFAGAQPLEPSTPVLAASPVVFRDEYRVLVTDHAVTGVSAYLDATGATVGYDPDAAVGVDEAAAAAFAAGVLEHVDPASVPGGWVLDVGRLDDGTWAVVEANPLWCAGPYSLDRAAFVAAMAAALTGPL